MEKIIIAAIGKNNVIGKNGKLPWKSPVEMKLFKETTTGFPVIMGRKTFESLEKPLENRLNIVVSGSLKIDKETGILVFESLTGAINYCEEKKYPKIFIIGGGEIFKNSIGIADEMLISKMKKDYEGDVYFPVINSEKWKKKLLRKYEDFDLYEYTSK